MADYRTFFDKEHLGAWDLDGRDCVVEISDVRGAKVGRDEGGKKASRKPIISFKGKTKRMVGNVTNASQIAKLYGNDVKGWIGKRITIYPTTTMFGRDEVDCIRVRPRIPGTAADTQDFPEVDPAKREAMLKKQDAATGRAPNRDEGELSEEEESAMDEKR